MPESVAGRVVQVVVSAGPSSSGKERAFRLGGTTEEDEFDELDEDIEHVDPAKSLIAADLADRVLVQLSYAIGVAEPLSIFVDSYGTVKHGRTDAQLTEIIQKNFDLRPGMIVKELDLQHPIYEKTARYGHFGRDDVSWEQPKKLQL